MSRPIAAPVPTVVAATVKTFVEADIPVTSQDEGLGLVQSGEFQVDDPWGGQWIQERVDCGRDMIGVEKALGAEIRMSVAASIDATPGGGSALRLIVRSTGVDPVARGMAATNVVAAGHSGGFPCSLTAAFASTLLDQIEQRAVAAGP